MKILHRLIYLCLLAPVMFSLCFCAPRKTKTTVDRLYELDPSGRIYASPELRTNPPRSLAVLPFRSLVGEGRAQGSQRFLLSLRKKETPDAEGLAQEMRLAFFGQLAQLPFHLIYPDLVDTRLKMHGIHDWGTMRAIAPQRFRDCLGVDAVIFGEVTHFDYIYAFLYTQLAAGLRLEMISTLSGEILWRFDDTRRDHTVRIALDPISLAVGLFQAGFSLRAINMTRSMDEVCREAVAHIPSPHWEK